MRMRLSRRSEANGALFVEIGARFIISHQLTKDEASELSRYAAALWGRIRLVPFGR